MLDNLSTRHWNYRLIHHDGEPQWIGLHEVYYADGEVDSWTIEPVSFSCDYEDDGKNSLIKSLEMALNDARNKPMLTLSAVELDLATRRKAALENRSAALPDD
jgi:hypothetical protein